MDNAAYGHADNDRQKRQEHLGTILYHHRKEEAEHAYRRGFHNHADNLVAYFRRCVEEGNQSFRPFAADGNNAGAYEEGEDNDRKDIGLSHGRNGVGRNHIDKYLHNGRRFLHLRRRCISRQGHAHTRLDDTGHCKADDNGNGRGHHVDAQGLHADTAQLFHIPHGSHAHYQRAENHRNNHHLDEVDKHGADRRNPCFHRSRRSVPQHQSHHYG